jgi:hypothetical protein
VRRVAQFKQIVALEEQPLLDGNSHEDLDELVEHDPIGDARRMPAVGMSINHGGVQRLELVPDGVDDGRWDSRYECSPQTTGF